MNKEKDKSNEQERFEIERDFVTKLQWLFYGNLV